MKRLAAVTIAFGMALAACGNGRPSSLENGPASGRPVRPPTTAPADGFVGFPTPSNDFRAAPSVSEESNAEPDFSGTGCFPDIPTPIEVNASVIGQVRAGEDVRLAVDVRATDTAVVEHRHAQEFDFSIDRDGQEVWRWSTVAPFTDPYGYTFTYEPGHSRRFTAIWDQSPWRDGAPSGDYVVHGFFIGDMRSPPPEGRFICFDESAFRVD